MSIFTSLSGRAWHANRNPAASSSSLKKLRSAAVAGAQLPGNELNPALTAHTRPAAEGGNLHTSLLRRIQKRPVSPYKSSTTCRL